MTLLLPAFSRLISPNCSSRRGLKTRLIVIHDCEGSYLGSVSWFAMARSQVSAHIVLRDDGAIAMQMVDWLNKAWAVCGFNGFSESYEGAGYAAKGLGAPEWQALANITAFRLRALGIPLQIATAANNWTGFCQHADLGAAGGGHHDVTSDPAVWRAFVALVRAAYDQPMPASWGGSNAPTIATPTPPTGWKPCGTVRHDLAPGSMEWVQATLNKLGVMATPMPVTGMDDAATQQAVRVFQRAHGLEVDGDPGAETIAALEKVAA